MKKIVLAFSLFFALSNAFSQELTPNDGLRYATDNLNGSARFRAMSGAFGALGGDLSSINVNPAGSAIFNFNQATVTLSSINTRNSSNYFGTKTVESDNDLDLNQAGVVFVFKNQNTASDWKKFSLAFNYENNANFDNKIYTRGVNPTNSIDAYFLRHANGQTSNDNLTLGLMNNYFYDNLSFAQQQAVLGYEGYIFNPVSDDPNNTQYVSNVPTANNFYQENYTVSTGYNGKLTGNLATSYKDRLFFGFNINSHFTDYTNVVSIYEGYDNDTNTGLQSIQLDTETYTFGNGISFGVGLIGKVTEEIRLGVSYESPTWYRLTDQQRQRVLTYCADCDPGQNPINFNPGITFEYDSYKLQTPSKWTGSLAYVFGEKGLLSIDYAMKDYSNITFRPRNDFDLESINDFNSNNLGIASEIRIGGEYKFKEWSFRGGYRYEESPFESNAAMDDLTGFSGGFGFDFGDSRLDLAYAYSQRKMNFSMISSGMNDTSRLSSVNNNVSLSYTIKF